MSVVSPHLADTCRTLLVKIVQDNEIIAQGVGEFETLRLLRTLINDLLPKEQRDQIVPDYKGVIKREPMTEPVVVEGRASVFYPRVLGTEQSARVSALRVAFELCHEELLRHAAQNRYRALAITALEEGAMWAIKAVSHEHG